MSQNNESEPIRRVMVIMAHPDDPEFSCGGSVANWTDEGIEVIYVILTKGDKGSNDPAMTPEKLAAIRQEEQRNAARVLGVKEVVFLNYPDGELFPSLEVRRDIVRQIRRYKPDRVVTSDPTRLYGDGYINHPDHRAAGEATLSAIQPAAGNRMYFPELLAEGLEPHKVREVYLSWTPDPNVTIDISANWERKRDALKEHKSQVNPERLDERFRRERKEGEDPPDFTEKFRCIKGPW